MKILNFSICKHKQFSTAICMRCKKPIERGETYVAQGPHAIHLTCFKEKVEYEIKRRVLTLEHLEKQIAELNDA